MKAAVRKALVIQQPPKRLDPNRSLPDVLMPVELRPARRLGVVAVPNTDRVQPDSRLGLPHRVRVTLHRSRCRSRKHAYGRYPGRHPQAHAP